MDWRNSGQVECYGYDSADRLTVAFTSDPDTGDDCADGWVAVGSGSYDHTYGYDPAGNLTTVDTATWVYGGVNSPSPNGLTTAGGNTFTYDLAGRQTTRTGTGVDQTVTWTPAGMAETVADTSDVTGFYYTADDVRVLREDPDGALNVTVGDWYEARIGHHHFTGTDHYTFAGQRVGFAVDDGTSTDTWFTFTDLLDSNTVFYNHTGNGVITRQWFDPWGAVRASTGTPPTEIGYTGQRSDPTGLIDYRARLYDPTHTRFLTPDTVIPNPENPADLNRYTYVRNNPATLTDPSGHFPVNEVFPDDCLYGQCGWTCSGFRRDRAAANTLVAETLARRPSLTQFSPDLLTEIPHSPVLRCRATLQACCRPRRLHPYRPRQVPD